MAGPRVELHCNGPGPRIHGRAIHSGHRRRDLARALASLPFRGPARRRPRRARCRLRRGLRQRAPRRPRRHGDRRRHRTFRGGSCARAVRGARESRVPAGRLRGAAVCRRELRCGRLVRDDRAHRRAGAFLDEVRRVLRPDGLLILSCPNKTEYTDRRGIVNEFHVRELYRAGARRADRRPLRARAWYGQRPSFYSVVWPEQGARTGRDLRGLGELRRVAVAGPRAAALFHRHRQRLRSAPRRDRAARVGARRSRRMGARRTTRRSCAISMRRIACAHDLDVCLEQANEVRADSFGSTRSARARSRASAIASSRRSTTSSTRSLAARAFRGGSRCRCAARGLRSRGSRPGASACGRAPAHLHLPRGAQSSVRMTG